VHPHRDVLAFTNHDLCHLEKFVAPEHYAGQVGFFSTIERGLARAPWRTYEASFDATWALDRNSVMADMNGSSIFLFAALKMKLKMAVRRRVAQKLGRVPPRGGALAPEEMHAWNAAIETLTDSLQLPASVKPAALQVSTKHDYPEQAQRLLAYFEQVGQNVLAGLSKNDPLMNATTGHTLRVFSFEPHGRLFGVVAQHHMHHSRTTANRAVFNVALMLAASGVDR